MKSIQDNFSNQSQFYKKYRPTYPPEIYQELMLCVKSRNQCWDCGTGNGQVAAQLASYFTMVFATDVSQNQLDSAQRKENIIYSVERAEQTSFADNQFDLITVAQAIHWFDVEAFHQEVKRVGKNGGIISIWGYGLLRIEPEVNALIDKFYYEIVGPFWDKERRHIDNSYASIPFDYKEIPAKKNKSIRTSWTIEQLAGYFNSWSSVQHFIKANTYNPVDEIISKIKGVWKSSDRKEVQFPIFMKIGEIEK
ncbi:MAG: class I SAM-dependent methyltransferase [Bacteroidota bacterium]